METGDAPSTSFNPLFSSFLVIMATEIGDKTFLLAAVLAMKHPRLTVFAGAFSALIVMTTLSAYIGHVVPFFLPKSFTEFIVGLLFFVFGIRMNREARNMTGKEGLEELEQVTQELYERGTDFKTDLESGMKNISSPVEKVSEDVENLMKYVSSPVFAQSFIMTFLGEWGDRSQIATVALAGSQDWLLVTIGSLCGHAICTTIAVVGGRLLASKISVKIVTYIGSVLFILCGMASFYEAYVSIHSKK